MTARARYRMAFYGDDFTGSTDALEVLAFAGYRCALFLAPPTPETLERFPDLDVVGVAGDSRAMSPEEMDHHLPAVFDALAKLGAPLVHYKVCSTFDSSPTIGSIGKVIELSRGAFPGAPVPIVAGTPALGRYCLFGNLFARFGTEGEVFRIDRHPIMSVHPVTPMAEADLAVHIARQAPLRIGKVIFPSYETARPAADAALRQVLETQPDAVLFDAGTPQHLTEVGRHLEHQALGPGPLFVVGSSGVEYALTQWWRERDGALQGTPEYETFAPVDRVLAVSGSASKLTALQIQAAIQAGFSDVPVDASALVDDAQWPAAHTNIAERAIALLNEGRSVILHTARGADDPRIGAMINALTARGFSHHAAKHTGGRILGQRLGEVVRSILARVPIERLLLSGGDTSSQVTKMLGPDALEIAARLAPGAPLCRALSRSNAMNGLEIALKGGQMGGEHFFERGKLGNA
ncbi:four-carbon acid sugar kinase family protein [Roseixanthobacter glucoisosaccharinicivorans]|uniref:four-carbon acid sugar kinase family protein n=1 Tax=Roseixanthobacter glucoisosaccharinicivorans TaxID=3119923 RepID=UPI003726B519